MLLQASLLIDRFYPARVIPVFDVDVGGLIIAIIVSLGITYKLKWWRDRTLTDKLRQDISVLGIPRRLKNVAKVVAKDALAVEPLFYHYKKRWSLHFLVFYGFVGLLATTTLDAIVNNGADPLPLSHPVKIIGNVSGLMLLLGATPMLLMKDEQKGLVPLRLSDRIFLPLLYVNTVSGFVIEVFDYTGVTAYSTITYLVHVALIVGLLASAPWTRFVHGLQAPYLSLYERLRQDIDKTGTTVDYKRLAIAKYAKTHFFDKHQEEKAKTDQRTPD